MSGNSGRIREEHNSPNPLTEEVTHMDKYIIERRARVRLAWFKRYGEIGNITQVCRKFGIIRKTFYKW
jgi:transcriptional regulator of acetoin/glycerol metabolism